MTVEGFCFSDRFPWFFGYWIPAFAGMTGCKFLLPRGWIPVFTGMTKFQTAFKRYGCVNNGRVGFSLPIPIDSAVFTVSAESCKLMPSFPRRRESRPLGTEIYRVKRFLRFYVLDSRVRGNDGRGFPFFPIDSRGFSVTRFPRSRE
ncbi:hypothetical protein CIJ84_09680 [Neisseria meningitidis]|uniref:Uncharacterized protein n=1 Tax=Neisseria meningitidis TaxID=487 RepID=A0AB37K895_NEIME|nr:hypothetical protein CIJ82_08410 [Neisseria meningitidis]RGA58641.1 hypothetical protein CIJ77_03185 [Neisseria meningitidis]RGA95019.1 hypothetical protein CIJ76_08345 [Neisseria meningitidis]RGB00560.1 hypothetical protein CIJ70_02380 [Neisseria meningitidis]RGB14821.1 hypothetical protein CIJ84_09680 [Neisseria meningitidis]